MTDGNRAECVIMIKMQLGVQRGPVIFTRGGSTNEAPRNFHCFGVKYAPTTRLWHVLGYYLTDSLFLNFPRRMSLKTQFKIEFFYRSTEVVWCLNKTPVPIKRKDLLVICPNHPGVLKVKASNKQINML